jgi:uncharacterized membrane protein YhaH (DUF805 family)
MLEAWFILTGRIGRLAYFGYSILLVVILGVVALLLLMPTRNSPNGTTVAVVVLVVLGLVALYAGICLAVKRLHDLDLSGWHYAWMALVPGLFNGIGSATHQLAFSIVGGTLSLGVAVYLLFWPGTDGMNRFGYKP